MRYRYVEYSPQNKRQYFIAVGLAELKMLQGVCEKALRHFPHIPGNQEMLQEEAHLQNINKGLRQAVAEAQRLVDTGERRGLVPNLEQDQDRVSKNTSNAKNIVDDKSFKKRT